MSTTPSCSFHLLDSWTAGDALSTAVEEDKGKMVEIFGQQEIADAGTMGREVTSA
jgi:hypothetical protein